MKQISDASKEKELSDLERSVSSQIVDLDRDKTRERNYSQEMIDEIKAAADYYFKPKPFEKSGKLYERLGVRYFKKFLFGGDYTNRLIRKFLPHYGLIKNETSLESYETYTRIYEGIHVVGNLITLPFVGAFLALGDYKGAGIFFGINAIVNAYPLMVQRYNRARIYNLLERKNKHKKAKYRSVTTLQK